MLDFTSITRVSNLTQTMKLQQSWERKKPTGKSALSGIGEKKTAAAPDLSQYHSQAGKDLAMKKYSEQQLIEHFQEEQRNNKSDEKLSTIMTKVQSGGKISEDEMEYLKEKNPTVYQKLKEEEADQKTFEKRVREAKTKDEVQQVRADHSMKALSAVNSVKNNPYISDADKAAIMGSELRMEKKADEILQKFVESGEYDKLPTQAEKNEAEKEIREAREREIEESTKPITEETEETPKSEDTVEDTSEEDVTDDKKEPQAGENTGAVFVDHKESASAVEAQTKRAGAEEAGQKVTFESQKEQRQSLREAESTPEAEKLRNAKRRKADPFRKKQDAAMNIHITVSTSAGSAVPNVSGSSEGFDISI